MRSEPWILLTCVACMACGAWLALLLRAAGERFAGRARQRRGERGEERAARVLEAHGYSIRARQAALRYCIEVDGRPRTTTVVADFVVERDGQRRVAEVKTGSVAPSVQRAETRRQLLEYQLATGAPSVLLVDADTKTITEVAFPLLVVPARATTGMRPAAALVLLALGLVAWLVLRAALSG